MPLTLRQHSPLPTSSLVKMAARRQVCNKVHPHQFQRFLYAAASSSVSDIKSQAVSSPMLTLERSIGNAHGSDMELCKSGVFKHEVFPDLPIATTWTNLLKLETIKRALSGTLVDNTNNKEVASPGAVKVLTVAVNLRSMKDVERRIIEAVSVSDNEQQAAGALLMVSGSHPVRNLPGINRLLPSSINALQRATELRKEGKIPTETELWAVANPNTECDASLLEAKVASGAEVILTQPTLDLDAFDNWIADAVRRGIHSQAKILVGMPLIASPSNLAFWGSLAGCLNNPACTQLLTDFNSALNNGNIQSFSYMYNENLIGLLLSSPGVAGMHIMPISGPSRRLALDFVNKRILMGSLQTKGDS